MSTIRKSTRDEMAKRLLEVLIARLDAPLSLTIPEETLEPMEIDEDWTLYKEFHPEEFDEKPDPVTVERLKATVSGTTRISIRVHNRVLQAFRQQADKSGVPYQTLMNRALVDAAESIK